MAIDVKKLEEGLNKLTGLDFEQCEAQERAAGNTQLIINTTAGFQARLAAKALGVPVADVRELPLKEYSRITQRVLNFLFKTSDEEETQSEK